MVVGYGPVNSFIMALCRAASQPSGTFTLSTSLIVMRWKPRTVKWSGSVNGVGMSGNVATARTSLADPLISSLASGSQHHVLRQSGTHEGKSSTSYELSTQVRSCSGCEGWLRNQYRAVQTSNSDKDM
jgi:hypothetical protein